jgi:hypothetical protein
MVDLKIIDGTRTAIADILKEAQRRERVQGHHPRRPESGIPVSGAVLITCSEAAVKNVISPPACRSWSRPCLNNALVSSLCEHGSAAPYSSAYENKSHKKCTMMQAQT